MGTRSRETYSYGAGLHTGFPHPFLPPVERASPQCVVRSLPYLPRCRSLLGLIAPPGLVRQLGLIFQGLPGALLAAIAERHGAST
jgi:hypothetical protein